MTATPLGAAQADLDTVEAIVRTAGTSFYRGMRILPAERRHAMYAIYAFCRIVDDIADETGSLEEKVHHLDAWRDRIAALYRGETEDPATDTEDPVSHTDADRAGPVAPSSGPRTAAPASEPRAAAPVSWPGLARPSTAGGAQAGKDVDGRHEAGHDTVGTVEPLSCDAGTCAVTVGTCVITVGTCAVTRVLALAIPRFQLRAEDFIAVIDGMQTDAETVIVAPGMAALDLYCDQVASAVGRLSVRAFGDTSAAADRVAYALGRALQLTNILRDIKEDAERGRIYLPREYLDDAGVPADPATIVGAPGLPAVCARLAERAHGYFRDASAAMELCNRTAMKPARIMAATYDALLSALERRGWRRLDEPVSLPKWKKLWIACRYGLT